jgi:hypothetical protein
MNEAQMGGAIEHWLGFQDKIGRSFMMNEDAIKYPLSDYLVNDGGIEINSILLERAHPDFSNRLIDVVTLDQVAGNNQIESAFEVKLAKANTRHLKERKRIFNDLIRLHLAKQYSSGKCYFIIAGKSAYFERDFRHFEVNGKEFYANWFSFARGKQCRIKVRGARKKHFSEIYKAFIKDYKGSYSGIGGLKLPKEIKTTCEFITAFKSQYVGYMAGIWSIE